MSAYYLRYERIAVGAMVLLTLALASLVGLLTPYLVVLLATPVFFGVLARGEFPAAYASYPARAYAGVFVVLAVMFAINADSVPDALRAFNFVMLAHFGPLALALSRQAPPESLRGFTVIAVLGIGVGLVTVLFYWLVLNDPRPRGPNIGPIVLANALLPLGFITMGAALVSRSRGSLLLLLVPVAAIAAVLITGSRGPLLGVPGLVLLSLGFLWFHRFGRSWRFAAGALGAAVLAGAVLIFVVGGRSASVVDTLMQFAAGEDVDESATIRTIFYRAGWESFLASPWIGHGWANMMDSIVPFLGVDEQRYAGWPQLHNDALNFAVAAGLPGLVCWVVILTTPLIGALASPRDDLRPFRVHAGAVLTVSYFFAGLTDLTFGFEFHTYFFVMLTAIVLFWVRAPAPPE